MSGGAEENHENMSGQRYEPENSRIRISSANHSIIDCLDRTVLERFGPNNWNVLCYVLLFVILLSFLKHLKTMWFVISIYFQNENVKILLKVVRIYS